MSMLSSQKPLGVREAILVHHWTILGNLNHSQSAVHQNRGVVLVYRMVGTPTCNSTATLIATQNKTSKISIATFWVAILNLIWQLQSTVMTSHRGQFTGSWTIGHQKTEIHGSIWMISRQTRQPSSQFQFQPLHISFPSSVPEPKMIVELSVVVL